MQKHLFWNFNLRGIVIFNGYDALWTINQQSIEVAHYYSYAEQKFVSIKCRPKEDDKGEKLVDWKNEEGRTKKFN